MKSILKTAGVLAAASLLGVALTQSVFAADDAPKKPKKDRFTVMDADKDGKVTLEEYKAVASKTKKEPKPSDEQIEKGFKRLDKDKSGSLSKEEVEGGGAKKPAKPAKTAKPSDS